MATDASDRLDTCRQLALSDLHTRLLMLQAMGLKLPEATAVMQQAIDEFSAYLSKLTK